MPQLTEDVINKTKNSVTAAFDEDKHLLEIMQKQIQDDPTGMNLSLIHISEPTRQP